MKIILEGSLLFFLLCVGCVCVRVNYKIWWKTTLFGLLPFHLLRSLGRKHSGSDDETTKICHLCIQEFLLI